MRNKKSILSVLGRIGRLFKLNDRLLPDSEARRLYYPSPRIEDRGSKAVAHPAMEDIQVEEIDQVEFMQEWSRSVSGGVERPEVAEVARDGDRRLPHFDRRNPNHDRRAGKGNDRRGCSAPVDASPPPRGGKHGKPTR